MYSKNTVKDKNGTPVWGKQLTGLEIVLGEAVSELEVTLKAKDITLR